MITPPNRFLRLMAGLLPVFLVAMMLQSCDEEIGCTNRRSDNYNPDAVRDDGSCINARDKFLGVYKALHICQLDSFPTYLQPTVLLTVAEDDLREVKDDVKLMNFGPHKLIIRALIWRRVITIPRQDLSVGGIPMTFKGEGHIDEDGYLTILYSSWLPNGQYVNRDCVIFCRPVL